MADKMTPYTHNMEPLYRENRSGVKLEADWEGGGGKKGGDSVMGV